MRAEDNELLCRVENGAPMGEMFRECFWTPAGRSARVIAGGDPVRIKLLGDNYVIFRGIDGKLGFLDEACPHRGVSLALGRNENCTLRCIFHGWRINTAGEVVEVPNEHTNPEEFRKKIKTRKYLVREEGGVIWVWLGKSEPKPFPMFEFMKLPPKNVAVFAQPTRSNWVQCLEGVIDSSHLGVLHKDQVPNFVTPGISFSENDNAPIFEVDGKSYGIEASAMRMMSEGSRYARVTIYVAPHVTFIPPNGDGDRLVHISVIHDDVNCTQLVLYYNADREPQPQPWYGDFSDPENFAPLQGDASNYWGQNREAMRAGTSYSGFAHLFSEDLAVQESAGKIVDRSKENLCSGDLAIARARRMLLQAVKDFSGGKTPDIAKRDGRESEIAARCIIIPQGQDWRRIQHSI
ncbi:MAG: Rieske 2Fe-2S domain-containing protein [Pseudorhodoplanes sp.]|uniref:Rieske 2Fe-2S domain-containing protein n=1 Tax=Pseudorhodoplanes sp. TaxID=1934341 RepID=UPI003D117A16